MTRRYDAVYGLLTDLGVNEHTADEDSCRMEHGISDESVNALIALRQYLKSSGQLPLTYPTNT